MGERWLPVVGAESRYEISDRGRVRSKDFRDVWGRLRRGRVLRLTAMKDGHLKVTIHGRTRLVHHLVLESFVGPRPAGTEACHGDGDPANNTRGNLRWDTRSANTRDSVRHGVHNSARKSRCLRGHLLREPNLMPSVAARGSRGCLACNRAHAKARSRGVAFTDEMADESYAAILREAL